MRGSGLLEPCCIHFTHSPGTPCADLVACVQRGPLCHDNPRCKSLRADRLAIVRRGGTGDVLLVGAGTCGRAKGAPRIIEAAKAFAQKRALALDLVEVGCLGYCQREVFVDVRRGQGPRLAYCDLHPDNIAEFLTTVFDRGELRNRFLLGRHRDPERGVAATAPTAADIGFAAAGSRSDHATAGDFDLEFADIPLVTETPFFQRQTRVVLANCGLIDLSSLDAARALTTLTPEEVCELVSASGLRGRGGAGFPTGQKWKVALQTMAAQKHLICNADEGDPGAFMDRAILEGDPFRVIEGMLIAAYAIEATKGYIYCRAEYPLALARLREAIAQCGVAGLLGRNILGSLVDFDITIKQGAGTFVCGEETAILASIEGGRGMPRPRPSYPAVVGLHGKPTVLNNVETLANVPLILRNGPEWFQFLGLSQAAGTKVFALSGQVQIGGPSGGCIPDDLLDVPADYGTLQELGAMMGSGGLVVMDERTCMVDVAKYFMDFIRTESCGKCTPCREGTTRMYEILAAVTERPVGDEIKRLERFRGILHLEELAETIRDTSLCGLGRSTDNPVLSTLRYFRDEYEAHTLEDRCPAGVCQGLREYAIDPALCIGCGFCLDTCPKQAIRAVA